MDGSTPPAETTAATGLYAALDAANWARADPTVADSTSLKDDAVAKFEAWQNQYLVYETMFAACWGRGSDDGSDAGHYSQVTNCNTLATNANHNNPLL